MYAGEPGAEGPCLRTRSGRRRWALKSHRGSDDN